MSNDLEAKRNTAVFADTTNRLRHTTDLPDSEIERIALEAVDHAVHGFDAKKDRNGNFIPQGIGSPGHETSNHFASLRRFEGEESYRRAVAEAWKRDPIRAQKLGLPQPART